MKIINWLDRHLEEVILIALLAVTSTIVFAQVIMRFVFQNSLTWSEELARYLFILMIYVGVSYGFKKHSHLRVDALDSLFGPRGRLITDILVQVILLVFIVTMTYFGWNIVIRATRLSAALSMPMKYVYLAPVVGFGLSIIRLTQNLIAMFRALKEPVGPHVEVE